MVTHAAYKEKQCPYERFDSSLLPGKAGSQQLLDQLHAEIQIGIEKYRTQESGKERFRSNRHKLSNKEVQENRKEELVFKFANNWAVCGTLLKTEPASVPGLHMGRRSRATGSL
mmetsp:Transcript_32337/g.53473  ORF Transcript_32337/g.53473 Transcript_32337/m.53473 type:complete len:114 (-) Transcript_32337:22-363(-)